MPTFTTASAADTVRVAACLGLPTLAQGVIKRRPKIMAATERLELDRTGIRQMQRLRRRYDSDVLRLPVPGRSIALALSVDAVARLLDHTPEPFSPATTEKRAALGHFQPHGVLISTGGERSERRAVNEHVLDTHHPHHRFADHMDQVIAEEVRELLPVVDREGALTWDIFAPRFWRIVRRVVLGDAAADDTELIDTLNGLRGRANWAYTAPREQLEREYLAARLGEYVVRAQPGTLAQLVAEHGANDRSDPHGQIPHWLFAFDAAGMATMRTLAVLAGQPEHRRRADQSDYLRACVLDTVRLWPTTPFLLRESTTPTRWATDELPAGTSFLIYTTFFHRDAGTLPYADVFSPEIWHNGEAQRNRALVPFSAGPADCPGRNLVLLVTTTVLSQLVAHREFGPDPAKHLDADRPLPATLNHFSLRLPVA
ncbi:cytochrome P450 [Thermocrispum municipale]|uniref:cytochrome P450 n=1 Tax=Thermocrispum municipale TaxID=37926 RepID=UPI00048D42FD|nr:cytochrome P450 [Thermocrispum municipale]